MVTKKKHLQKHVNQENVVDILENVLEKNVKLKDLHVNLIINVDHLKLKNLNLKDVVKLNIQKLEINNVDQENVVHIKEYVMN